VVVATDGEPSVAVGSAEFPAGVRDDGAGVRKWRKLVTKSMSTFWGVGA
jgi:hypothetical protein